MSSTIVDFYGKGLILNDENDATEIVNSIRDCENLTTINLEGNTLGILAAEAIGNALKTKSELKYAYLKDLFTGRLKTEIPDALKHLTEGIKESNATLKELDLSDNAFGPIGMKALVDFLGGDSCKHLKVLRLNNNGLGIQGATLLASVIGKLTELEILVIGRNRLENDGSLLIAESLQNISTLKTLVLPQNGIRVEGMKALSNVLMFNKNISELNLNDNTMTEEGAIAMSNNFKFLNNIQIINLGDCLVRTKGCKAILNALNEANKLTTLKELLLNGNEIGKEALDSIISNLSKCKKLSLDLSNNNFGTKAVENITNSLEKTIQLTLNDDEGDDEEDKENAEEETDPNISQLIESDTSTIDDLCSELINISINGFDEDTQNLNEKTIKQSEKLFSATSKKCQNSYDIANSLLVNMGLLKNEDGKYKKISDLRGPFISLKKLTNQMDKTQKDVLQLFIGNKSNREADKTGKIKTQLMQALYQ